MSLDTTEISVKLSVRRWWELLHVLHLHKAAHPALLSEVEEQVPIEVELIRGLDETAHYRCET